ncbi:MAG: thymidine phosphorylase [Clostridia bacterium]|nr:thymidine phosphorylase [Clostridia bacterium]
MRMYDVIQKKKTGGKLTDEEIRFFVEGYTKGDIPDYQAAALCMAIYFNGMTLDETAALTYAIRDSGQRLDFSNIKGIRVDKHSTGGVGDKTSLAVSPIVASYGVKMAKISGRGLGHTGGTIDKLESIPGFRTDLSPEEFEKAVNGNSLAIVGQSADIAPADKKIYALRDVTATVDSMPLIVSSIMGKKLAVGDDCILLDVKTGSGSFMKTLEKSEELARIMVEIGRRAGKKMRAIVTDMDRPLGNAIGNSLEVIEAVKTLRGEGPADFYEVCVTLAANLLNLAGKGTVSECTELAERAVSSGAAFDTLTAMVRSQGGDTGVILDTGKFKKAGFSRAVRAGNTGYIRKTDTEGYGVAALLLGAGRNTKEESIDYSAGIILKAKTGDFVNKGDEIATLYTDDESRFTASEKKLLDSTVIGAEKPEERPLILSVIE